MSTQLPVGISPDEDLSRGVEPSVDAQVKSLPVVAFGHVVGVSIGRPA